MEHNTITTI